MPRKNGTDPEARNRAVEEIGRQRLKKFRRGVPVGVSQQSAMDAAARWGQLATRVAVLRLISLIHNPAVDPSVQKAASDSLLDRFGFPKRNDVSFAGVVAAGTPQDFQSAIDRAVADFMANREAFRVEAVDVTPKPEFVEPEGNGDSESPETR